eukprot:gene9629-biopygen8909
MVGGRTATGGSGALSHADRPNMLANSDWRTYRSWSPLDRHWRCQ